ncbi:MAG TPA: VIT1/CCC1 transporter family protein [Chlamydiales bacterium]|nr:VIT1/CCC1 transporter family protein [Chlamydiales bacterium]
MNHFKGKEALQHVIDARIKGKMASAEVHGTELPGHVSAAADAAKETSLILLVFWTLLGSGAHWFMLVFISGWLVWKVGRSAILGWARLERLHRVIEEERWEIEHHRPQEKEELRALYAAKGFSGKLLDEAVEVLMADDNRLLQVMLEEELGLSLESYEHPLKQASGAFVGVVGSTLVLSFALFTLPAWGPALAAALIIALSAGTTAQLEKNRPLPAIVWNLAIAALAAGAAYFLAQIVLT